MGTTGRGAQAHRRAAGWKAWAAAVAAAPISRGWPWIQGTI